MVIKNSYKASKYLMLFLALYPILDYYQFANTPFTYASILVLLITPLLIMQGKLKFAGGLPSTYMLYWVYSAIQIYFFAGIGGWSDYIPGGVLLTIFSLSLLMFSGKFNPDYLYKYMRIVFIFATCLFAVQHFLFQIAHTKISVFLPLSSHVMSSGMTYKEMVAWQTAPDGGLIERFSSIFSEPSHFAQYCLFLLGIELFRGENKDKLYTKFALVIVSVMFFIQSGVGFMGLGLLALIKLLYIVFTTKQTKYYLYLAVLIPVLVYGVSSYLSSSSGAYISERTEQLDFSNREATNSGFVRIYYGWFTYGDLSTNQQIVGTSRDHISTLREGGFFNGVTYVLCSQGIIGLILLILFYASVCRKQGILSLTLALQLLWLSLMSSTYLGGLMLIVSSYVLGTYKNNKLLT